MLEMELKHNWLKTTNPVGLLTPTPAPIKHAHLSKQTWPERLHGDSGSLDQSVQLVLLHTRKRCTITIKYWHSGPHLRQLEVNIAAVPAATNNISFNKACIQIPVIILSQPLHLEACQYLGTPRVSNILKMPEGGRQRGHFNVWAV